MWWNRLHRWWLLQLKMKPWKPHWSKAGGISLRFCWKTRSKLKPQTGAYQYKQRQKEIRRERETGRDTRANICSCCCTPSPGNQYTWHKIRWLNWSFDKSTRWNRWQSLRTHLRTRTHIHNAFTHSFLLPCKFKSKPFLSRGSIELSCLF